MVPVLYADDDILIVDKPCGLAVQPGEGVRTSLVDVVERDLGFRPYLVHRLDRETAGCIVVARSPRAAARVSELLGGRGTVKTYRALVAGLPSPATGAYRDAVRVRGRELSAETRYRVALGGERFSLVEAELGTGRNHQVRLHFAAAGHPILGDDRHGDFALNRALGKELGVKKLMLYAWRLILPLSPPVEAVAALPPHFTAFFERSGFGTEFIDAVISPRAGTSPRTDGSPPGDGDGRR